MSATPYFSFGLLKLKYSDGRADIRPTLPKATVVKNCLLFDIYFDIVFQICINMHISVK